MTRKLRRSPQEYRSFVKDILSPSYKSDRSLVPHQHLRVILRDSIVGQQRIPAARRDQHPDLIILVERDEVLRDDGLRRLGLLQGAREVGV